jgi:hypothetical protein
MTQTQVNQLPAFPSDMPSELATRFYFRSFCFKHSTINGTNGFCQILPCDCKLSKSDGGQDSYKIFEVAIMEQALQQVSEYKIIT